MDGGTGDEREDAVSKQLTWDDETRSVTHDVVSGGYLPLIMGETVTLTVAMMARFQAAGIPILETLPWDALELTTGE